MQPDPQISPAQGHPTKPNSSTQSTTDHASGSTTQQPPRESGTSTLFENRRSPAAASQVDPTRQAGEDPLFVQMQSWPPLSGFNERNLPAAFEVDEKRRRRALDDGYIPGSSASSRELSLPSALVKLDPDARRHEDSTSSRQMPGMGIADIPGNISDHETQYICGLRRDIFPDFLESARRILTKTANVDKRGTRRPSSTEVASEVVPNATTTRALEDDDLRCIIAHVVRILGALHHASILSLHGLDSPLGSTERESVAVSKAILPQATKEADTATTITLPQSFITPIGTSEEPAASNAQLVTYEETKTTTTLVSHSTVTSKTEISWITSSRVASSHDLGDSARRDSADSRSLSVRSHDNSMDAHGGARDVRASVDRVTFLPQDTTASRRESTAEATSRAHVDFYPSVDSSVGSSERSIVSFPALQARHCTNDWLSPPASTPGVKDGSDTNLYDAGIDAHTGTSGFASPHSSTGMFTSASPVTSSDLAFIEPAYKRGLELMSDDHVHRLGTSLGTSSGRKRSHHAVHADAQGESSSVLQKLRNGSVQFGQALASAVGGSGHVQQQSEQDRRVTGVDRMKAILDRSSAQHGGMDAGALPRVGAASPKVAEDRRCETCSEDGRPHMCVDEGMSSNGSR
ncbi:hypothetical protein BR93DRAFT_361847 [Coniochaeta sp. PMI_546]|nr:hypothetical protein BR93DRAFT_361847 [Coniochaeta sp. PMI_546]